MSAVNTATKATTLLSSSHSRHVASTTLTQPSIAGPTGPEAITAPPSPAALPPPPDLAIPRPFLFNPKVRAALNVSQTSAVADKVGANLEQCTTVLDSLHLSDDAVNSFLQNASEAAGIVGDIGSRAPLVGVVFAALSAISKRFTASEDTRSGFNGLYMAFITTAQLVQMAENSGSNGSGTTSESRSVYPAEVQQALDSFWRGLYELARLLCEVRGEGYARRLLDDGRRQRQLKDIRQQLEQAKGDLQLSATLAALPVLHSTAEQVGEVRALLTPPHAAIDEAQYAVAIKVAFGRLLGFADVIGSEQGSPLRALGLQDVWVEQDVVPSQDFRADELELLPEHVNLLRASGQLEDEVKEKVEAHARFARKMPTPVLSLLGDAALRRVVLLGHPGMGKSSALRECALQWAAASAEIRRTLPFPILVELKQYKAAKASSRPGLTLLQYLCDGGSVCCSLPEAALTALLRSTRPVLLMLDGLDELFDQRSAVVQDVKTFLNRFDALSLRVVVTSRIIGYERADLDGHNFQHFTLQELKDYQIDWCVERWHAATYTAIEKDTRDARRERLLQAIRHVPSIKALCHNPLLLTMLCIVNRGPELPTRRVRLYEKCVELLLAQWQVDLAYEAYTSTTRDILAFRFVEKQRLLRELAKKMQNPGRGLGLVVQENVLEQVVCGHVMKMDHTHGLKVASMITARAIIQQLRTRHYVISWLGDHSYAFVHRTFLEYFVAAHYKDLWNSDDLTAEQLVQLFRQRSPDNSWREVLILLSGMIASEYIAPCIDVLLTEGLPAAQLAQWMGQFQPSLSSQEIEIQVREAIDEDEWARLSLAGECVEQLQHRMEAAAVVEHLRVLLTTLLRTKRNVQMRALPLLVRLWPGHTGDDTRAALSWVAQEHPHSLPFELAIATLCQRWLDEDTRQLLRDTTVFATFMGDFVSKEQCALLVEHWSEHEDTRPTMERVLLSGCFYDESLLHLVVERWPDARTRKLLSELVGSGCASALSAEQVLWQRWPDEDSRQVLIQAHQQLDKLLWSLTPLTPSKGARDDEA